MRAIEPEPALGQQPTFQLVGQRGRGVDDGSAVVADDVHVVVLGRTVRGCTVIEVGVPDHPDLLEQFEGAVHGRQVDLGDGVGDLLRGRVPERADGAEHAFALRRHAQPA